MKIIKEYSNPIVLLVLVMSIISCSQSQESKQIGKNNESAVLQGAGKIAFDTTAHHFGTLVQGEKVGYNFRFTNVGDAPLIIKDVKAGCGCTVASWSKDPVAPGNKGTLEIVFDSAGRRGSQYKTVRVFTNGTSTEHELVITAEITLNT